MKGQGQTTSWMRRSTTRGKPAAGPSAPGAMSLGALAVGAGAFGAVAIGALAIRKLTVERGRVRHLSIEELDVGRLRVRELITAEAHAPQPFEALESHTYVSLTTFRKSGEEVSTPLWFALADGRLYATTPRDSGKMKRIRNNPRVRLTPCNARGKPKGESVEGLARVLEEGQAPEGGVAAFHEKYRRGLRLFHLFGQTEIGTITLEVSPAEEQAGG